MSTTINSLAWWTWTVMRRIVQATDLRLRLYRSNLTPILVYQMGKVGSMSIAKSLVKNIKNPVFHVHALLRNAEDIKTRPVFDFSPRQEQIMKLQKLLGREKGLFIYENIIAKNQPVKVITLTREPIGRNLAAFFQNFEMETGKTPKYSNFTSEELGDMFVKYYPHFVPLQWFDKNVNKCLGIDVYDYDFPREKGFLTIQKKSLELLILKVELPNQIKEKVIGEFLGLPEFRIVNNNLGEDKDYSDIYKNLKQALKLPYSYVEEMCNSRYFRHFYTKEEIEQVFSRWTK